MNKFYTKNDNFQQIINDIIGDFNSCEQISTGWTNFVFRVKTNNNNYIFRFPKKNELFSSVLEKEVIFSNFINNKLSINTPNLLLHHNNNRPFSVHKELKGKCMSSLYPLLTIENKQKIAKQIATFIHELQTIDITSFNYPLSSTSDFLIKLSKVDNQDYDLSKLNPLIELEKQNLTLSHADLNPGNILLDDNYNVSGILDFAFISYTHNLNDVARLIGRLPKDFYNIMIKEYNNEFNTTLNTNTIDEIIKVWNHVEYHYIIYMKNNHPEIDF